jgi:hypothetical protein
MLHCEHPILSDGVAASSGGMRGRSSSMQEANESSPALLSKCLRRLDQLDVFSPWSLLPTPFGVHAVAVLEYVGYLTQRIRRFRPPSRFDRLSGQRYEFLMRSECVRKPMAVWDNGPKPLLGANQKWVLF